MAVLQIRTFADFVSAIREELQIQRSDTNAIDRIKRDLNFVYNEVVAENNWWWLQGNVTVQLPAYVSGGTAAVTAGSSSVTLSVHPGALREGWFFALDGYNEIYRIESHAADGLTLKLDAEYTGTTNPAGTYKIWTDKLQLPTNCKETTRVWHDHAKNNLENLGLQEFRRLSSISPRASGKPGFYYTGDYKDPSQTSNIALMPALTSRSSVGSIKTLVFGGTLPTGMVNSVQTGDPVRLRIGSASHPSYNGDILVSSITTTNIANDTIIYTGLGDMTESGVADANLTVRQLDQDAEYDRYRELHVYPSLNSGRVSLHVDFIKEVQPLVNDSDEPVMPLEDRIVLVYGALHRAWSRARNPEEATRNFQLYQNKLAKMQGKLQDSFEKPRMQPSKLYLASKRSRSGSRNAGEMGSGFGGGGGASGAVVTGSPNTVATFDANGDMRGYESVSTTELGTLDGVTSAIQPQIDSKLNVTDATPSNSPSKVVQRDGAGNFSAGTIAASLTGNVTGNVAGNLTGNVTGNITGNVTGDVAGDVTGNVTGNLTGNVNGSLTGNVLGNVTGNVSGTAASITGNLTGDVTSTGMATSYSGTVPINKGGTGQTAKAAAFDALAPTTTKGDLAVHNGTNNARQAIGSYGQVLTADPSAATGVKWAAAAASSNLLPKYDAEDNTGAGFGVGTTSIALSFPSAVITGWSASPSIPSTGVFTTTGTTPLAGSYSYKLLKQAAGQVWYQNFTVPRELRATPLTVEFSYEITGTYTDADLTVGIYANDGSFVGWLQPAPFKIQNQTGPARFCGEFQTTADATSYTLAIVQTTAGSWTSVNVDSLFVGRKAKAMGAPTTDEADYVITAANTQGFGTPANPTATWRQVGDNYQVKFYFEAGTTTASEARLYLPNGAVIKNAPSAANRQMAVGYWNTNSGSAINGSIGAVTGNNFVTFTQGAGSRVNLNGNVMSSGQAITGEFWVAILGKSSSTVMSSDAATTVISGRVTKGSGGNQVVGSSPAKVTFPTAYSDKTGFWDSTNNRFVMKVPGSYRVASTAYFNSHGTGCTLYIYKNGSIFSQRFLNTNSSLSDQMNSIMDTLDLVAGDYVEIFASGVDVNTTIMANATTTVFSVERLSGPTQIAASENAGITVSGSSATGAIPASTTLVNFSTTEEATHGGYSAGVWTAQSPGTYLVESSVGYTVTGTNAAAVVRLDIFKGASSARYKAQTTLAFSGAAYDTVSTFTRVKLLVGEQVKTTIIAAVGSAAYDTAPGNTYMSITRVGNY